MMNNIKRWLFIVTASLIGIALFYGVQQKQPTKVITPTHPTIANEKNRQQLIQTVWDSVEKQLKNKQYFGQDQQLTTEGVAVITNTVNEQLQQIVDKEALVTDQSLMLLKQVLIEGLIASYNFLDWCPCMPPDKRIDLAFQIARDVKKQYPNRTQKLMYVSLGSGDLLQDFVILESLIDQGYCNLDINIIDFKYGYVVHTTIQDTKKVKVPGVDKPNVSATVTRIVNAFANQLQNVASKRKLICSVDIETFTSVYKYIELVKNGLEQKANIIIMADPTRVLQYLKVDDVADANIIEFSDNGLLLCMPENQKPKAYLPLDSSKKFLNEDKNEIIKILQTVKQNNYRATLKRELVNYIEQQNKKGIKRSLTFYADPFITFQDLIINASTANTLAFGLYDLPGQKEPSIDHINTKKYKQADVVTPNIGSDLTSPGRPTKQYRKITL